MVTAQTMVADVPPVSSDASLVEAARLLRDTGLAVLPVHTDGHIVGSISEGDLAVKGCAAGRNLAEATVAEIMTSHPLLCPATAPVETALELMARAGTAALIVQDAQGRVIGVATLAKVLEGMSRPPPEGPVPDSVKRVRGEPV